MRTWQIYLLALCTITAVCADDPPPTAETTPAGDTTPAETTPAPTTSAPTTPAPTTTPEPPKPSAPTNIQAVTINSTAAVVSWEWNDENVDPANIEFVVSSTTDKKAFNNVTAGGKKFLVLNDLIADNTYTIKVILVAKDGFSIESDSRDITTLKEGSASGPVIQDNENAEENTDDKVTYRTTWTYTPADTEKDLLSFQVIHCTSFCEAPTQTDPNVTKVEKALDYYTEYTVFVVAVLRKDGQPERTLAGQPSVFKTITGTPGKVEKLKVTQKDDTFDFSITWSQPNQPNGEIQNYDLEVIGAGDKSIVTKNLTETNFDFSIKKREDIVESYEVKVRAVNNGEGEAKFGQNATETFQLNEPAAPTDANMTERTGDSLKFTIETNSDAKAMFQIYYLIDPQDPSTNQTRLTEDREVTLTGLQPVTDVPLKIAVCVPLEGDDLFCGVNFEKSLKTNVGAPSEVRNLTRALVDGNVTLSWAEPETLNGPLDGYIFRVADKTKDVTNDTIIGKVLEFSFNSLEDCTEYEFSVRAFNENLDPGSDRVEGKPVVSALKTVNCTDSDGKAGFPAWAIVLIVLALLALAGGGAFYFLKVRRNR